MGDNLAEKSHAEKSSIAKIAKTETTVENDAAIFGIKKADGAAGFEGERPAFSLRGLGR
jgi:hypothetical protein